jgi:hypothetical protein
MHELAAWHKLHKLIAAANKFLIIDAYESMMRTLKAAATDTDTSSRSKLYTVDRLTFVNFLISDTNSH